MKKSSTILLFAFIASLMVGCGSQAAAMAQPSAEGGGPNDTLDPVQAPTTAAPTTPADAPGTRPEVTISLGDNSIDSSQTTFKAGVTYRFKITNYGANPHTFHINEPVDTKGSYQGALSGALLAIDHDQLDPGESLTVDFTFPPEAVRKQWEFSDLRPNYYTDGIRWPILVTK